MDGSIAMDHQFLGSTGELMENLLKNTVRRMLKRLSKYLRTEPGKILSHDMEGKLLVLIFYQPDLRLFAPG